MWDARPELGDHIMVVGYGLIGALIARLCQETVGVQVHIVETDEKRAALAKHHGFNLWESTSSQPLDMAFHTSGTDEGLQFAIDRVRREGKVIELSWYGSRKSTVVLGDSFHYDRKQIISSQVSNLPNRKQNDWDYKRRKALVFELLSKLDFSHLVGHSIHFDQSPDFFNSLRAESPSDIGIIIDYNR
jgi:threonine dehydrogenase-like Zn-dependent dehydrogenase